MQIVRFRTSGKIKYGVQQGTILRGLQGNPFGKLRFDGTEYDVSRIKLLAPCKPSKIICLGLNYHSHAKETNLPVPEVPLIFMKPSTAVIGPEESIMLPKGTKRTDYEGELGLVIKKKAKAVPEKQASDYILGYTCFNDVSERYNQRDDGQWTRAKSYDTFAPIGPCIETEIIPNDLKIETYLNGDLRQSSRTSDLIFDVYQTVSFISNVMTLLPGDVIATGTPAGIGPMKAGDVVEVRIENVGNLKNPVSGLH